MKDRFGDYARQLAGAMSRMLGWPPHWFWHSTPDEILAILQPSDQSPGHGMSRSDLDKLLKDDGYG